MKLKLILFLLALLPAMAFAEPIIYVNQVGFDSRGPKMAVVSTDEALTRKTVFHLVDAASGKIVFTGVLSGPQKVDEWMPGKFFYQAEFGSVFQKGSYKVSATINGKEYTSPAFQIDDDALAKLTIQSIIHYYHKQRATTPQELAADQHLLLYGSDKRVDLRGGWCDAGGDVSKYFSHLAYANFMSPQQIPLVVWSMESADEAIPAKLEQWGVKDSLENEALYGADYIARALSDSGYFYMTVFSYFKKDPEERRVVGLHANSVTTNEYQCAYREGGGMGIAALARISRWKKHGDYTSAQYLAAAKKAFAHLEKYNLKYDDDHKENIIDDYCALMAATELWKAAPDTRYRDAARKRAENLEKRLSPAGYFIADDGSRPYWHASDAGLPIVALARYVKQESNPILKAKAVATIKKALDYNLRVTGNVDNPFGYARQTFALKGQVKDGFFIPHENETGWWWQGEDARLASLATAALVGGRLAYHDKGGWGTTGTLEAYASQQTSWILGCNPYSMCFMYGFGIKNVPYMHSSFGHGAEKGGISNGITGKDGNPDGSGIDFKEEAKGDEWRWTEQWIPHAAWFLQAVAAMAER